MTLEPGARLPDAEFVTMGANGPETVSLAPKLAGRKVVMFGLPGAFTGTCSTAHMPSFTRNADALREKGVDEIICVSVNDPFVMQAWSDSTGAAEAGITMLGDADASFTNAVGMAFSVPAIGLHNRSGRYAMIVEDGVVATVSIDEPGVCDVSSGERILEQL